MSAQVRIPTILRPRTLPFFSLLNSLRDKTLKFPRFKTLIPQMITQCGPSKRPTCPSCSKPTRMCLCTRLKTPSLDNSIAITILQHSHEKKHPLNSARIATLGLKNVDVISVSDVNFQARFLIRLLDQVDCEERESGDCVESSDCMLSGGKVFDEETIIDLTVEKHGAIRSSNHSQINPNKRQVNFDALLASNIASDDIRKGFAVKRLLRKALEESNEYEESEEFEAIIPPGSVLLFPSEKAVSIEALDFGVRNLIVLDGTWAKAKRVYNENPWLKLLPHLRLDLEKSSLYSEVRHQPRAGYLSTIESIVYAMKALGEDCEGLDGLLEVFESMVSDQRRCKDERLNKHLWQNSYICSIDKI